MVFLALAAASYFAHRQTSIIDKQADISREQLNFIREQEADRKKKEELYMIIAPLYTKFKEDEHNIIDWMSQREITKIHLHTEQPEKKQQLTDLEANILEIMRQRKGYAHEPLYSKIDSYESSMPNLQDNNIKEIKDQLNEILRLVKIRYAELGGQ